MVIALYLAVQATRALSTVSRSQVTAFGLVEAAASVAPLPILAGGKYRLARRLKSQALRADSLLTWSGVALSSAALIPLTHRRILGWWWADPVAALVIAAFLVGQGRAVLRSKP